MKKIIGVIFIFSLFSFIGPSVALAGHTDSPPCYAVSGVTDPVPNEGGIANSGQLDFDVMETIDQHGYRACNEVTTPSFYEMSGYAWNTNLGYVSFRCMDGMNRGIECGSYDYGSSAFKFPSTHPRFGDTVLVGYAWGENTGWISLSCLDFDGDSDLENVINGDPLSGLSQEIDCGDIPYETPIPDNGTTMVGYVWSENLGWLSMAGVTFDLKPFLSIDDDSPPPPDDGTTPPGPLTDLGPVHPAGTEVTDITRAYANGTDMNEFRIRLLRGGVPISCSDTNVSQVTLVMENSVYFDQASRPRPESETSDAFSPVYPSGLTIDFFDSSRNPVDGSRICDEDDDYFRFRFTSVSPTDTVDNPLNIESVVVQYASYDPFVIDLIPDRFVKFYEPVEITDLRSATLGGTFITRLYAVRNTPNTLTITAMRHINGGEIGTNESIDLNAPFTIPPGSPYNYFYDPGCDGPILPLETTEDLTQEEQEERLIEANEGFTEMNLTMDEFGISGTSRGGEEISPNPCVYAYLGASDATGVSQVTGATGTAGLGFERSPSTYASEVRYNVTSTYASRNGQEVIYDTSGLPPGETLNQFARVQGGLVRVDADAFREVLTSSERTQGAPVKKPIGEFLGASKNLRDRILRTLSKFIKRPRPFTDFLTILDTKDEDGDGVVDEIIIDESDLVSPFGGSSTIGNVPGKNMFYFSRKTITPAGSIPANEPFRVVISNPDDGIIDADIRVTLVCEGCNFFVDADILAPAFLSLIVIDDLSSPTNFRNQGNIYVCGSVTETNLTIFADGSLYHYGRDPDPSNPEVLGNEVCTKEEYTGVPTPVLEPGDLVSLYTPECPLIEMENGMPSFEGCSEQLFESNILINQWTNYGQLFVRNTIGASTFIPPITGEGEVADSTTLFLRARRQDINFMRWAKWYQSDTSFDPDVLPPPQYCWEGYIEKSPSLGSSVCVFGAQNYPPKEAVVNIFFKDSRPLPIFGELSR